MHPRRALLHKIASVNGAFDATSSEVLAGETSVETRNTIYRFRDGLCFAVVGRDGKPSEKALAIVGMRLVGWLVAGAPPRLTRTWQARSCAVLWRPCATGEEDGAMALTSPTTELTRGITPARLQAFHDASPPLESVQALRDAPQSLRADAASMTRVHPHDARPRLALVPGGRSRLPSYTPCT